MLDLVIQFRQPGMQPDRTSVRDAIEWHRLRAGNSLCSWESGEPNCRELEPDGHVVTPIRQAAARRVMVGVSDSRFGRHVSARPSTEPFAWSPMPRVPTVGRTVDLPSSAKGPNVDATLSACDGDAAR